MSRIGIDLGGTKTEIIVLDSDGGERHRRRVPTPRFDYDGTLTMIEDLVRDAERLTGQTGTVGLGTPGAISPATGLIKNANSTWLNGRPLRADLERILERPIRIENDANCFALSEAVDGAAARALTVFGVIVGTGTGGGIVVAGRPLTGPNAIAGEWGHNPLPWPRDTEWPGPPCYCGKTGCIETFLSGPGLESEYERVTGTPRSPEEIVAAAARDEAAALSVLETYADRMSRALAGVINILDPDIIVLGGGMSNLDYLYAEVPRLWGRYIFSDRADTPLRRAAHGDSSGVRGAAWLWDVTDRDGR